MSEFLDSCNWVSGPGSEVVAPPLVAQESFKPAGVNIVTTKPFSSTPNQPDQHEEPIFAC